MNLYKFEDMNLKEPPTKMIDKILEVGFFKMVVAVRGDSYSGKTTCADAIAKEFRCSVISLDSVMDSLSGVSRSSLKKDEERVADLAFGVLMSVARLQFKVGRPVVIDSPLTKPGHLEQLVALVDEFQRCGNPECDKLHCRFVIVECRPKDKLAWEQRFKRRPLGLEQSGKHWYKPKEWKDVVRSKPVEDYSPGRLPSYVSTLTVDTTSYIDESNLVSAALDICMCPKGHTLGYNDWRPDRPFHTGFNASYAICKITGRKPPRLPGDEADLKWRPMIVIAVKGDAGTGKTTCANAIAKSYGCTLLTFDDILDSLSPSPPSSPEEEARLFDIAFDIIRRLVKVQMSLGQPVVIDSPLDRPNHLRQLLRLKYEFKYSRESSSLCSDASNSIRIVVVECRPKVEYVWEQSFKKHTLSSTSKWYKTKDWAKIRRSKPVEQYFSSDHNHIPDNLRTLVVDTSSFVCFDRLGPATFDLCFREHGCSYDFETWQDNNPENYPQFSEFLQRNSSPQADTITDDVECSKDGRHFLQESLLNQDENTGDLSCRACQEPVSDPVYICELCKLTLHKSCAELEGKTEIHDPHSNLPSFLRIISRPPLSSELYSYKFKEPHNTIRCDSCRINGEKEFWVDCTSCLWEVHLQSRLVPTILRHEGYSPDLSLCFWITSTLKPREYRCAACKLAGCLVGYSCLKRRTFINYHVECVLMPRVVDHVHGLHHHQMRLTFKDEDVSDDYLCHVCQQLRDPSAWYYSCDQCTFYSHLHCIYDPCD